MSLEFNTLYITIPAVSMISSRPDGQMIVPMEAVPGPPHKTPGLPSKTPGLLSENPSLVSTSTEVSNPWMNGEYPEMKTVTLSAEGLRIRPGEALQVSLEINVNSNFGLNVGAVGVGVGSGEIMDFARAFEVVATSRMTLVDVVGVLHIIITTELNCCFLLSNSLCSYLDFSWCAKPGHGPFQTDQTPFRFVVVLASSLIFPFDSIPAAFGYPSLLFSLHHELKTDTRLIYSLLDLIRDTSNYLPILCGQEQGPVLLLQL